MKQQQQNHSAPTRDLANDEQLFTDAYECHGPELLAYLRRLVGNTSEAEDLFQETFARAWRARDSLRDPRGIRPWLYQIARRLAIDHHRHRGLISWKSLEANQTMAFALHDPQADLQDELANQDLYRTLLARMSNSNQRRAIELAHEGYKLEEICRILQVGYDTAKMTVYRGHRSLRRLYQQEILTAAP